jgi:D-alanyl-D-alanine carboxypeptidase
MTALLPLLLACSGLPDLRVLDEAPARVSAPSAAPPAGIRRLDAELEGIRATHDVPAMGAVIVDSNGIRALGVAGRTHTGDDAVPVQDGSPWHMGSNGKALTAMALARLVDRGTLSWDDTVGQRLPDLPMHADWQAVTLDQLMHHVGSVPANTGRIAAFRLQRAPYGDHPRAARLAALEASLEDTPAFPPGGTFMYSNLGYTLAGAMAEAATDTPWETLLADEVLDPLGLRSAAFGAPTGDAAPWGHNFVGPVPADPAADNPPAISPAGTLHMALVDQATLVQAHLTNGAGHASYLPGDAWERLHTPGANDYAMGWITIERDWSGGPFFTHDGSNTMWYARAVVAPGIDRALVVVTNQGPPSGADAVREAEELLRTLPLE